MDPLLSLLVLCGDSVCGTRPPIVCVTFPQGKDQALHTEGATEGSTLQRVLKLQPLCLDPIEGARHLGKGLGRRFPH